jgi:tetratricopeptide (TPR) repeat protein
MSVFGLLLLVILTGMQLSAQQKPPDRKDSTTVSAGISKEQLAQEAQLNDLLALGDKARRSGDAAEAIRQFEKARDMVHSQTLLAEQEDRVLTKLGGAYLAAKRPSDAIATYTAILKLRRRDCPPESSSLSQCADAERSLGISKMLGGDFAGALSTLGGAEANYGNAAKPSDAEEFRMIETKEQAETRSLISVALFRLGRNEEATEAVESAIVQLEEVESDANIQQGIRNSAADSLRQAQAQLEQMKR